MSFSKAIFLTSLTCFTLGMGGAFAACTNIVSSASGCNFEDAVAYVGQGGTLPITFEDANTYFDFSSGSLKGTSSAIANVNTVLESTVGGLNIIVVGEASEGIAGNFTMGPSSSPGTIAFLTGAGKGQVVVEEGALVFGPKVVYPTSANDLYYLTIQRSGTLELQKGGTIGSVVSFEPGTLYLNMASSTVTFDDSISFSNGSSAITGASNTVAAVPTIGSTPGTAETFPVCKINIPSYAISGNLFMGNANLTIYYNQTQTAGIFMQGNCTLEGALLSGTTLTLTDNTTISLSNSAGGPNTIYAQDGVEFIIEGTISGDSPLTISGPGSVTLTATNTFSDLYIYGPIESGSTGSTLNISSEEQINGIFGNTTYLYQGATLNITAGTTLNSNLSSPLSGGVYYDGGAVKILEGKTLTLNGGLIGQGLTFASSSTASPPLLASMTLNSNVSSYEGLLTFTGVAVSMGADAVFYDKTVFTLQAGSSLDISALDLTVGGLTGDSSTPVILGLKTLTINQLSEASTVGTPISGTGGVTYQVATGTTVSTVTVSGASSYTGTTTLNEGITLAISAANNLGSAGPIVVNGGTNGAGLLIDPSSTGSGLTLGALEIGSGTGTISLGSSSQATIGTLSGVGNLLVTGPSKDPGVLVLSAVSSSYSGQTTINGATLQLNVANAIKGTSALVFGSSGGTLNTDVTQTLLPGIQVGDDDAIFAPATSTTLTISGAITNSTGGTGGVIFAGGGTTVLEGSNAFAGNTTIKSGVLQIRDNSTLGSNDQSTIFFEANSGSSATLDIQNDLSSTRGITVKSGEAIINVGDDGSIPYVANFTGLVDMEVGPPQLTKTGAGILSLLPTKPSALAQITLIVEGGGVIGSSLFFKNSSAVLSTGTTLTFTQDEPGDYYGSDSGATISGAGGVIIDGAKLLNFLVPEEGGTQLYCSYTGGTTLKQGILAISADRDGTSPFGVLGDSSGGLSCEGGTLATVLVDSTISSEILMTRSITLQKDIATIIDTDGGYDSAGKLTAITTLDITGVISGEGGIVKAGPGTLNLVNSGNTFTGRTTVQEGTLNVSGSILSSEVLVSGSGVLPVSALDLLLAATLKGSGTLKKVEVIGNIRPGGSIGTLTILEDLTFEKGASFVEEFNALENASLIDVGGTVTINSGAGLLVVPERGTYSDSLNLKILESVGGVTGEFVETIAPAVVYMKVTPDYRSNAIFATVTPLEVIVSAIAGRNATTTSSILNEIIVWNRANLDLTLVGEKITEEGKIGAVLKSLLPLNDDTLALNGAVDQLHPSILKNLVVAQETASIGVQETLSTRLNEEMETLDCARTRHAYTFWINGMGNATNQENTTFKGSPQVGYNNTMAGFAAGADYRFIDLLYVGALGGFTSSHVKFQQNKGTGDINTGYFGLYLAAIGEGFFANVSVTGGWNGYSANRHIEYSGTNVTAKNSHGGRQLMSHLEGGLNLPLGKFNLRPFDRFDYLSQQEYGYKEKNAGDWNLSVNKNTSILLRNELGLQFASCFQVKTGKITVSPKVSWVREVRTRGSKYTTSFTDAEDFTFSVTGYFPNRSLFSTGGVITGSLLEDKLSLSAYYDGEFTSGYSAHRYGGEVRVSF